MSSFNFLKKHYRTFFILSFWLLFLLGFSSSCAVFIIWMTPHYNEIKIIKRSLSPLSKDDDKLFLSSSSTDERKTFSFDPSKYCDFPLSLQHIYAKNTAVKNAEGPSVLLPVPDESHTSADPTKRLDPLWVPLINRLVNDGFDSKEVVSLFSSLGLGSYSSGFMAIKITELHGIPGRGPKRLPNLAPTPPSDFLLPTQDLSAGACLNFIETYADDFNVIQKKHGVSPHVITAILLVETELGINLGESLAFQALASMAATTSPELLKNNGNAAQVNRLSQTALHTTLSAKSAWAYNELTSLIMYGKSCNIDIATVPGSFYGAIGLCQFMPSNIVPYGVDGDNDGHINLFSTRDAIHSVANYLEAHGWRAAKTYEQKISVIKQYNYDNIYASRVLGTARQLELAQAGKVSKKKFPLALAHGIPGGYKDPSLRGKRSVSKSVRIKSLNSYQDLLN